MKKLFVTIAICAIIGGAANAQSIKILNSNGNVGIGVTNPNYKLDVGGKVYIRTFESINGWYYSYLHWLGHSLVMGSPVGNSGRNVVEIKPGGAEQLAVHSEIRMYTADAPNLQTLKIRIQTEGNTYFNNIGNVYFNNIGNVGIGTTTPAYKLHVVGGDIYASLDIYSRGKMVLTSDERLKSEIRYIFSNEKENLYLLQGKFYKKTLSATEMEDSTSKQKEIIEFSEYGYLAQELKEIFPYLVCQDNEGYYAVNYIGLIPIIVEALKDQKLAIENLQQEVDTLKTTVNNLLQKIESLENVLIACCSNKNRKSIQEFELTNSTDTDAKELKIYQNVPNPFNETTIITCYIPENIQKAELCVYDMQGSLLKCFLISERGTTSVQIQAGQLAAGIYTYLLIGDAKTSDTKQIILTK
jgi:hypothetical protein